MVNIVIPAFKLNEISVFHSDLFQHSIGLFSIAQYKIIKLTNYAIRIKY